MIREVSMKNTGRIIVALIVTSYCSILWAEDPRPKALVATGGNEVVYLQANPAQMEIRGYYVYRALPNGEFKRLNAELLREPFYADKNVVNGQDYWYVITAVDMNGVEHGPSKMVKASPTPQQKPMTGY
jgi:hypothetical protein